MLNNVGRTTTLQRLRVAMVPLGFEIGIGAPGAFGSGLFDRRQFVFFKGERQH
jgi:hypothetical protein